MKVLVTGGTGFVGQEIVRQLARAGHTIRLLTRRPALGNAEALARQFGVEIRSGDVVDAGSIAGALTGIDGVIHLVGIISELGRNTFENVHVLGARNLVAEARRAGVGCLVHMSALGTRAGAVSRYHQSKWLAEESVRASGMAFTIFRPSLIYGPGDQFVNLFARIIRRSPVVPLLGRKDARFQPVAVGIVASAFVRALADAGVGNQTYDLCGPETLTLSSLTDELLAVMQRRRLKLHVPGTLAKLQAMMLESVCPLLGQAPPLNRDQLLMLQEDNVGNGKPANERFGLRHPAFCQGIAQYLAGT